MTHTDGSLSSPMIDGPAELTFPMPLEDSTHFVVRQPMMVLASAYTGPVLNELHGTYTSAYCVGDENVRAEGRVLRFDRMYATLPANGDHWESDTVTFPRYAGLQTGSTIQNYGNGTIVINYIYGESREYLLQLDVPVRRVREYFIPNLKGGYTTPDDVKILPRAQPFVDNVLDVADGDYAEWVAQGLQVVVEATQVERYMGNIWRAQTTFAKAR